MSSELPVAGARRRIVIAQLFITSALLIGSVVAPDAGAASPESVLVTTHTVNTITDTDDGVCDGTHCSLREAIKYVVAGDTINFSALFNSPQRIKLTSALPVITKNLTITGPGSDLLGVRRDTGGDYSVFDIEGGAVVSISGMTMSNGSGSNAGGIYVSASTLTLSNVAVTENHSSIGDGGIKSEAGSTLTINNSVIGLNTGFDAAIESVGSTLTIANTLVVANRNLVVGGIDSNGTAAITNSAIVGNTNSESSFYPAGFLSSSTVSVASNATLTNTTISGNSVDGGTGNGGSAIVNWNFGGTATMTLENCTIVNNTGNRLAAVTAQSNSGAAATIHLKNTILDNPALPNLAVAGTGATIISDGNNLSNDNGSPFLRVTPPADVISTDPKLAPLAYYGGPTPTHLLLPGSPAIDAGNNLGAPAADQRGVARPVGAKVDIGAVEMNSKLINLVTDAGDGTCDATCTLRDAVLAANAAGATLTDVQFDPAVFGSVQTIKLASALPNITGKINLAGPGPDLLEVRRDTGGDYPVFDVVGGTAASISGMTIANGSSAAAGGIVNNASTLALSNLVISGNQATGTFGGGGIYNSNNGKLTLADSTVSFNNNSSTFGGGGISNVISSLTLSNTLVARNSASGGGGGIFNASGQVNVTNSTISNNFVPSAGSSAGGLYSDDYNAPTNVTLVNTTLSGNSAGASTSGSAILNNGVSINVSNLTLSFCTVANNAGSATSAVLTSSAGASIKANTVLGNSIFSNVTAANLGVSGAGATVTTNGYNLASDGGSGLLTGTGDLKNTDPKLARLGNYGGTTPTQVLLPGSPAANAGNDLGAPLTDQRGVPRPASAHVNIGAVEMNPRLVNSTADPGDGTCDATCTLRDALLVTNAFSGTLFDIEFDPTVFASPQTINLGAALPDIIGHVDIIGTGANRLTVRRNSADPYSIFTIDAGAKASMSGLTVSNGQTSENGVGGGISNAGALTLARMTIDGNQAPFGSGGGVFNHGGTLTIDDSTISNNTANDGAGVYNSPGFVHLTNTTISGNNTNGDETGGITNLSFNSGPAIVSLLNSTITNNSGGTEGGIYTSYDGVTKLKNTIIAGNSSPNITGQAPCAACVVSLGNNLANDSGAGFLTASGDLINLPALLAPLAYHGGPTQIHFPLVGSPAAHAGNPVGAPLTDQRGYPRSIAASVDIGAVESDVLFRDGFDSP